MGGGVRVTVLDTTSAAPAAPAASSKNADLAAIYMTSALARFQNRAWHPMGLHGSPMGRPWEPMGAHGLVFRIHQIWCERGRHGSPRADIKAGRSYALQDRFYKVPGPGKHLI